MTFQLLPNMLNQMTYPMCHCSLDMLFGDQGVHSKQWYMFLVCKNILRNELRADQLEIEGQTVKVVDHGGTFLFPAFILQLLR